MKFVLPQFQIACILIIGLCLSSCSTNDGLFGGFDFEKIKQIKKEREARSALLHAKNEQNAVTIREVITGDPELEEQFEQAGQASKYCQIFSEVRNDRIVNVKCEQKLGRYNKTVKSRSCARAKNQNLGRSNIDYTEVCGTSSRLNLNIASRFEADQKTAVEKVIKEYSQNYNKITSWSIRKDFPYFNIKVDEGFEEHIEQDIRIAKGEQSRQIQRENQRKSNAPNPWSAANKFLKKIGDQAAAQNNQIEQNMLNKSAEARKRNYDDEQPRRKTPVRTYQIPSKSTKPKWNSFIKKKEFKKSKIVTVQKPYITKGHMVVAVEFASHKLSTAVDIVQSKILRQRRRLCGEIIKSSISWATPTCMLANKAETNYFCKQPATINCWSRSCWNIDKEKCGSRSNESNYKTPFIQKNKKAFDLISSPNLDIIS